MIALRTTALVALFAAFVHHLVLGPTLGTIGLDFIAVRIVGTLVALFAIAWVLVGLAYLVTGRRWRAETLTKAVSAVIVIGAGLAIFGSLSR